MQRRMEEVICWFLMQCLNATDSDQLSTWLIISFPSKPTVCPELKLKFTQSFLMWTTSQSIFIWFKKASMFKCCCFSQRVLIGTGSGSGLSLLFGLDGFQMEAPQNMVSTNNKILLIISCFKLCLVMLQNFHIQQQVKSLYLFRVCFEDCLGNEAMVGLRFCTWCI